MSFENYMPDLLEPIENRIYKVSEMTLSERQFLNGLIQKYKPQKIVEIGVAAGGSSAIILNAIKDDKEAKLYSIDYFTPYYRDNTKKTGFVVNELFPELMDKWELYTGGVAANFLDKIGTGIDLCLLDTTHNNPGEFLDFLMVFPYMKPNGIIVIHDISLHTFDKFSLGETCSILMSTLKGQKIIPQRTEHTFPNIGAVILSTEEIKNNTWDFFNLLNLKWQKDEYLSKEELLFLAHFLSKHYKEIYIDLFNKIIEKIESNKTSLSTIERPHKKKAKLSIVNIFKSYFLFPIYIYKIYKRLK